ncbi:hypothetical protein FHX42_004035 [Saccharopolyspora lacisalsi]|uniref:ESAT-6 protein secretion system EspG family protein n=1 Tax=Halosaccharopolyspora lacisalsi TaxID=1000566 RepID=A0A839E273_9PSEU|nr:ESX secretion-associated protein EspG [Halosaccharopolyspora lacisalsi]MBA8826656.1 hypothetical protein [Halosaccharopolyspora lacisalsi]
MVDTITLSIPAVDVLGEQLNLGVRQYPFEFPRVGGFPEHREQVVRQVHEELDAAGLAGSGRPEPEVEDALYLLSSSEVSIAAAGLLDVRAGYRLAARVVATGEVGVVAVLTGRGLRMDFMSPDDLPGVCADLLPEAPPGAGEPASVAGAPGTDAEGTRAVEAITSLPKYRLGHYVVANTERRRRVRLSGPAWFDTDRGRYALSAEQASGQHVLTCAPVDRHGMAERIGSLLEQARAG